MRNVVLREAVVRTSVNGRRILFARKIAERQQQDNNIMRHQAYKQYVYYQAGRTGAGNRMVHHKNYQPLIHLFHVYITSIY